MYLDTSLLGMTKGNVYKGEKNKTYRHDGWMVWGDDKLILIVACM